MVCMLCGHAVFYFGILFNLRDGTSVAVLGQARILVPSQIAEHEFFDVVYYLIKHFNTFNTFMAANL